MGSCAMAKQKQVAPTINEIESQLSDILIEKVDISTLVKPEDLNLPRHRSLSVNFSDKLNYQETPIKFKPRPEIVPRLDIKKLFPQNQLTSKEVNLKKQAWHSGKQKGGRLLLNTSKDFSFPSPDKSPPITQENKPKNLLDMIKNSKSVLPSRIQTPDESNNNRMEASQAILESSWVNNSPDLYEAKIEEKPYGKNSSSDRKLLSFPNLNYLQRNSLKIPIIPNQDIVVTEESEIISEASDETPIRPGLQTPGSFILHGVEPGNQKLRATLSRISTMKPDFDQNPTEFNSNEPKQDNLVIERTKRNLLASL